MSTLDRITAVVDPALEVGAEWELVLDTGPLLDDAGDWDVVSAVWAKPADTHSPWTLTDWRREARVGSLRAGRLITAAFNIPGNGRLFEIRRRRMGAAEDPGTPWIELAAYLGTLTVDRDWLDWCAVNAPEAPARLADIGDGADVTVAQFGAIVDARVTWLREKAAGTGEEESA